MSKYDKGLVIGDAPSMTKYKPEMEDMCNKILFSDVCEALEKVQGTRYYTVFLPMRLSKADLLSRRRMHLVIYLLLHPFSFHNNPFPYSFTFRFPFPPLRNERRQKAKASSTPTGKTVESPQGAQCVPVRSAAYPSY